MSYITGNSSLVYKRLGFYKPYKGCIGVWPILGILLYLCKSYRVVVMLKGHVGAAYRIYLWLRFTSVKWIPCVVSLRLVPPTREAWRDARKPREAGKWVLKALTHQADIGHLGLSGDNAFLFAQSQFGVSRPLGRDTPYLAFHGRWIDRVSDTSYRAKKPLWSAVQLANEKRNGSEGRKQRI